SGLPVLRWRDGLFPLDASETCAESELKFVPRFSDFRAGVRRNPATAQPNQSRIAVQKHQVQPALPHSPDSPLTTLFGRTYACCPRAVSNMTLRLWVRSG